MSYFESLIPPGSLMRVCIVGASEGGLLAIQIIEQHPDRFAAGLALCAPAGGAPKQIKDAADFRVVFDYFFPDGFPFGAFNVPPDAFKDWETVYVPRIIAANYSKLQNTVEPSEIAPWDARGGFFTLSGVVVAVGIEPTTSRM